MTNLSPERGILSFRKRYIKQFEKKVSNILERWKETAADNESKYSGQFANVRTASYYAVIKSYTETCRRKGINEMEALMRLCAGNPFTVEEIFSTG